MRSVPDCKPFIKLSLRGNSVVDLVNILNIWLEVIVSYCLAVADYSIRPKHKSFAQQLGKDEPQPKIEVAKLADVPDVRKTTSFGSHQSNR